MKLYISFLVIRWCIIADIVIAFAPVVTQRRAVRALTARSTKNFIPPIKGVVSYEQPPCSSIKTTATTTTTTTLYLTTSESDQTVIGLSGTVMALVVLYSEFTLKNTGCGLPAGPFGIVGFLEGISYLGIVGIAGYSLYNKVKTGSGLPAGPGGVLGAAEGLSFLAIVVGLVVLGFQVSEYGYIPNAVATEGSICK